jgi:signal recognition particle receptor subunit beta
LRPTWADYFSDTAAIIYVVDSTEFDRLDDAAFELRYLLDFEGTRDVRTAPLLVFANKQDLEGAKTPEEISEALKLEEFRNREWKIIACSAVDGSGIAEGMGWLVVSDSRPFQASSIGFFPRRLTYDCVAMSSIQRDIRFIPSTTYS